MIMKKFILYISLLLALPVSEAQSQYLWHVIPPVPDSIFYNYYSYTAISCFGDVCTVAGLISRSEFPIRDFPIFFRSTDGGRTWTTQDPHLRFIRDSFHDIINCVVQLDSLTAFASGCDSGMIVLTTDGGVSWVRRDVPVPGHRLLDIHFSDTLTGIAISSGYTQIHITSNGGRTWTDPPFQPLGMTQCYSYGKGNFRLYNRSYGNIYTTHDYWQHTDSTDVIFHSALDSNPNPTNCTFAAGDTILAFGNLVDSAIVSNVGLIVRTTNGGMTWEQPFYFPYIPAILHSSPPNRDTVFAGGQSWGSFFFSTDMGKSWQQKKLILDTPIFKIPSISGIALTKDGTPLMLLSDGDIPASKGTIVRGIRNQSKVESYERIIYNTYIYPNPAALTVNILTLDALRPVIMYDMLGREVRRSRTSDIGRISIDVSMLSRGIYDVILDHYGKMLPVGKVAVAGR